MSFVSNQSCILVVTPEVIFSPAGFGKNADYMPAKLNTVADFSAHLIIDMVEQGLDVHVAQPDYRTVFSDPSRNNHNIASRKIPGSRVHLTKDRVFFYTGCPESNYHWENVRISLAFQREVINYILPRVQPDLIHCHGWMTGLVPAMARRLEIPSIFSFHNLETGKSTLSEIEEMGIDSAAFWQRLFFDRFPVNYEETRETNPADFLLSGIFAADYAGIADSALLVKIGENLVRFPETPLGKLLSEKLAIGCYAVTDSLTAGMHTIDMYERLLKRPVIKTRVKKSKFINESMPAGIKSDDIDQKDRVGAQLLIPQAV